MYVAVGGAFEMNDGATIIGCAAVDSYGGGVYCEGGFTMNGGAAAIALLNSTKNGADDSTGITPQRPSR